MEVMTVATDCRPRFRPTRSSLELATLWLLVALAPACQATMTSGPAVQTVMSPDAPFSRYRTFSFGLAERPSSGFTISQGSLDAERRLRPVLATALASKGYAEDVRMPDFVVRLGAGTTDNFDTGAHFVDDVSEATPVVRGLSLAIDVYDATTGVRVWHGDTVTALEGGNPDDQLLKRFVANAFAELPGRTAGPPSASRAESGSSSLAPHTQL
jgi:hypothetical protein